MTSDAYPHISSMMHPCCGAAGISALDADITGLQAFRPVNTLSTWYKNCSPAFERICLTSGLLSIFLYFCLCLSRFFVSFT